MLKNLSDFVPAQPGAAGTTGAHTHGPDCDHDHAHGGDHHGHSHEKLSLAWAILGGVLVLNSGLAKLIYPDEPFASTLSAILGALILATPIWLTAIKDVLRGKLYMNELVALGVLAAFVRQMYLEAGIISFFMLLAILVEEKTAIGAKESIEALIRLTPSTARRLRPDGTEEEIPALELKVGDKVRVRPGENFPADGKLVRGTSTVNQASITGESLPVDKQAGDQIYAGTENLTGSVDLQVTGVGQDTTLGKVRDLILAAESTRLPIMRLVDRYVVYYTPTILMIAGITWFFTHDLLRVVLVLVISCPCALVLATPSAVIAAIAAAARLGILIKNVAHIEIAAQIKAVVFDKTGTLTEGKLEVARLAPADGVELADLLAVAVAAESQSNHPAAKAMRRLATEASIAWEAPAKLEEVPGRGVVAESPAGVLRVGRQTWLKDLGLETQDPSASLKPGEDITGMSIVYVARNEQVLGWIGLRDAIRPAAKEAIAELQDLGIVHVSMVTGDNESVAKSVARKVGIREISAECLPEQKVAYVEQLKERGFSVAVVGDGVNDAPALAAGDIGIAMGAIGSDVAVNSASIALMNNDLRRIPFLIRLSRQTRAVIHQNLLFGAFLIVGGLMLFIFGSDALSHFAQEINLIPSVLQVVIASFVHVAGSLVVLFNSARLVRFGEGMTLSEAATPVKKRPEVRSTIVEAEVRPANG